MRDISEIIEDIGIRKLKKTPNGYVGCCAINEDHYDQSPSMHIHFEKGIVKCFACGAFKPLFSFLTENGATFDEAVNYLFVDFKTIDRGGLEELKEYYLGTAFPKSMIDRGFTKETLRNFEVGYDTFEKRITMPLRFPPKGALIGIQYRQYPKVIWGTDGFNKDNFIYNFEPTEERYYVEGLSDTWRVWQNGNKNVSAPLTANISETQMDMMLVHKKIHLAFDKDKAGIEGNFKIYHYLRNSVDIDVIPYLGKDPGDCTEEQWKEGVNNPISFLEYELIILDKNPELYDYLKNKYT